MNKRFVSIVIVIIMLGLYSTPFYCHLVFGKGPSEKKKFLDSIKSLVQKEHYITAQEEIDSFLIEYPGSIQITRTKKLKAKIDSLIKVQERFSKEAKGVSKRYDEFTGITFYEILDNLDLSLGNCNERGERGCFFAFYSYAGEKGEKEDYTSLVLGILFFAPDWLFIDEYIIKADTNLFRITPEEVKRDVHTGYYEANISESYIKSPLNKDDIKMIETIISSEEAKIRFSGSRGRKEGIITKKQKTDLQNTLNAYKIIKRKNLLKREIYRLLIE